MDRRYSNFLDDEHTIRVHYERGIFCDLLYGGYYFYLILWLHNWGRPLSEEKKSKRDQIRKQMRDYQRYNLYHRLYLFADATEAEYQAEKANQTIKRR